MDQVMNARGRDPERMQRVAEAMATGVILVDADGKVVWMDRATRRHVNGGLESLVLPMVRSEEEAVDCFAAPVELTVNSVPLKVCVVRQTGEPKSGNELVAALESLMTDGTSWFAAVVDKLKAIRQGGVTQAPAGIAARGVDVLSNREREVLGLICEGKSDSQMGELLGLSENTVRNHIASLYRKIGVNRRTAAIIWARERGIAGRDGVARRHGRNGNGHSATY